MGTSWYLDINNFARSTAWAHAFMRAYALWAGIVVLGIILLVAWWQARRYGPDAVAKVAWAVCGTLVALGLNQPLSHLVARARPYAVLHGVEVLVPRANDFTLPSDHATIAGAVICGLIIAWRRGPAIAALVAGLFLAFARVYVGAHYPGDVAAGLAFGALVVAVLAPLGLLVLRPIARGVARTPLRPLVAARTLRGQPEGRRSGPAGAPAKGPGSEPIGSL